MKKKYYKFKDQNHEYNNCKFCNKKVVDFNLKRHEKSCYLNPENKKNCPVCGKPIKKWKTSTTCGYSCSNTYFRSGKNNTKYLLGNETYGAGPVVYKRICFENHGKKCLVCDEDKIVAVHHLDGNRKNNDPENLIPLCPTHHCYMHSKYKNLIEEKINGV